MRVFAHAPLSCGVCPRVLACSADPSRRRRLSAPRDLFRQPVAACVRPRAGASLRPDYTSFNALIQDPNANLPPFTSRFRCIACGKLLAQGARSGCKRSPRGKTAGSRFPATTRSAAPFLPHRRSRATCAKHTDTRKHIGSQIESRCAQQAQSKYDRSTET